eukprot:3253356-Ditylum_brightwellii.AAC.1
MEIDFPWHWRCQTQVPGWQEIQLVHHKLEGCTLHKECLEKESKTTTKVSHSSITDYDSGKAEVQMNKKKLVEQAFSTILLQLVEDE